MAKYAVKILLDFEAADDIEAKVRCKSLVAQPIKELAEQIREITVRDMSTFKSLKITADGTPQGTWQKA